MDARLQALFRPVQANGRTIFSSYVEIMPSPVLKPYISCYWYSEPTAPSQEAAGSGNIDRVIPDGCTDILFEHELYDGTFQIRYCGLLEQPFTVSYDKGRPVRRFGIRFFPGGAFPFIKMTLERLTNHICPLDDILPIQAEGTAEELFEKSQLDGKAKVAETFLISLLRQQEPVTDDMLKNVLHRIFISGGTSTVTQLAEYEAVSSRHMTRKFQEKVGISPKKFSEIVRFQLLVQSMKSGGRTDWSALALNCGYFDQAHMIRDFKRFYGVPPVKAAEEYRGMSVFYNHFS